MRSLHELLLFQPAKYPTGDWQPEQLHYRDVWLKSADGTKLHAWYLPAEQPQAIVLYAHGNAGHLASRAGLFKFLQEKLQLTVLGFDYRGYGRSEGKPTIAGALRDALAARAELARLAEVHHSQIVLMGRSLGGAIAIHLAAESSPRGLIVESTFPSLHAVARVHYAAAAFLVPKSTLNNVAKLAEYEGPFLYSHGTADEVVPFALGQQVFAAANDPKTFVELPGADHNTRGTAHYYNQLQKFVVRLNETQPVPPEPEALP